MSNVVNCDIVWEDRGCVRRFFGLLDDRTLRQALAAVHGNEQFDRLLYVINDLREVESCTVTPACLEEVAATDYGSTRSNNHIRVAMISTSKVLDSLIQRYQDVMGNSFPIVVFRDPLLARSWAARVAL